MAQRHTNRKLSYKCGEKIRNLDAKTFWTESGEYFLNGFNQTPISCWYHQVIPATRLSELRSWVCTSSMGFIRILSYSTYSFDRDGGLFARVKIERANNTLRQAESIIRFAAERKIVKYELAAWISRVTRALLRRSTRIYVRGTEIRKIISITIFRVLSAFPFLNINSL